MPYRELLQYRDRVCMPMRLLVDTLAIECTEIQERCYSLSSKKVLIRSLRQLKLQLLGEAEQKTQGKTMRCRYRYLL